MCPSTCMHGPCWADMRGGAYNKGPNPVGVLGLGPGRTCVTLAMALHSMTHVYSCGPHTSIYQPRRCVGVYPSLWQVPRSFFGGLGRVSIFANSFGMSVYSCVALLIGAPNAPKYVLSFMVTHIIIILIYKITIDQLPPLPHPHSSNSHQPTRPVTCPMACMSLLRRI